MLYGEREVNQNKPNKFNKYYKPVGLILVICLAISVVFNLEIVSGLLFLVL